MTKGRTEEDLLNPGRIFSRLLNDYSDGKLQPGIKLYRARVEAVDTEGGRLENQPPNPPNSIRARIYSSGLDVNMPSSALSVFHPLLPGHLSPTVSKGEHVYVTFEDAAKSSGVWISTIASYHELNYSNPDERQSNTSDASTTFEGDQKQSVPTNPIYEYGGATIETQGRQEVVDDFEVTSQDNPWRGKRILMVGDSQVGGATMQNGNSQPRGALATVLRDKLTSSQYEASFFKAEGRIGWGVYDWVRRTFGGSARGLSMPQPSLSNLIEQYRADIVILVLGGNDGSTRRARNSNYTDFVARLWDEAGAVPMRLWVGPPTAVGNSAEIQPFRKIASDKIRSVVGRKNFVDSIAITNTTNGRDRLGIHFTHRSDAVEPWANLIIQKGAQQ